MEVAVDELNMRARPSTSARVLGGVSRGNILVVHGAPVASDGYTWYAGFLAWESAADVPALPVPVFDAGDPLGGWFAASLDGTAYVRPLDARCPDVVDLKNVAAMLPAERLVCFGDRSIEVKGTIGCVPCSPEIFGDYAPEWLTNPNRVDDLIYEHYMEGGNLMLRFRPGGPDRPDAGSIIRVRGHFRDDAAEGCEIGLAYPWADAFRFHPVGPAVARQLCRQEFVVERYEILGTDPRFER